MVRRQCSSKAQIARFQIIAKLASPTAIDLVQSRRNLSVRYKTTIAGFNNQPISLWDLGRVDHDIDIAALAEHWVAERQVARVLAP